MSEKFFEACEEAKRIILSFKEPIIVHHYDADGISAASIVKKNLIEMGKKHKMLTLKKLDDESIEKIYREEEIIFVDLGNYERVNELKDVVIIDHHQVNQKVDKFQINPLLYNIDGSTELSSAGTAYFIFRNNASLGIVGAVGDMQYDLKGMNSLMLDEGKRNGEIEEEIDIKLYGRYSRPLIQFLAYSEYPYIPGITYSEEKAKRLIESLGIELKRDEKWTKYADLTYEEKKKLVSAIAELIGNEKIKDLVGKNYVLKNRPKESAMYDAHEFATLLNACGRHEKAWIGVEICIGNLNYYRDAEKLLAYHRKMLKEGLEFAKKRIVEFDNFYLLDARKHIDEGIIGIVCGMVLQGSKKPIIGIAESNNNKLKISARAQNEKINLGKMLKEASERANGAGGGHKQAAGAWIERDKINEFLVFLNELIEKEFSTQ